jgi:hypothetical protein
MKEEIEENQNVESNEPQEQEKFEVELEGTLKYKISIKSDKYKFESDATAESEFIMIENTISALNMTREQWPVLKKLIANHPDKNIRKQAKESLPSAEQRMRIDAAVYELEKIRDRIIWGIYQNALNPIKTEAEQESANEENKTN